MYEHQCDYCGKNHLISSSTQRKLEDGRQLKCYCSNDCKSKAQQNGKEIICDNCGKKFYRRKYHINRQNGKHQFCCVKCESEYKHKQFTETRQCEVCGKTFVCSKSSEQRFCSIECQSKWQKTRTGEDNPKYSRIDYPCDYCGAVFKLPRYRYLHSGNNYCSHECLMQWLRKNSAKILDTNPQLIVNSILEKNNITFTREYNIGYYSIDNYLDETGLMIEVMGDYWHCNPTVYEAPRNEIQAKRISCDTRKHNNIKNQKGVEILYLWESDILNNIDMCEEMILEYVRTNGSMNNYHSFNYHNQETIKMPY